MAYGEKSTFALFAAIFAHSNGQGTRLPPATTLLRGLRIVNVTTRQSLRIVVFYAQLRNYGL